MHSIGDGATDIVVKILETMDKEKLRKGIRLSSLFIKVRNYIAHL
jgi:hypothetical protein